MENVYVRMTDKQFSKVLGLDGDFWKTNVNCGDYGHLMTFYNTGTQVFLFIKEYNNSGGVDCFCVALLANHGVDENRDRYKKIYCFPSPVFCGFAFGKAIIKICNIRSHNAYFSLAPRYCLHLARWHSCEVEDYDVYRFQKLSIRMSFFKEVFGVERIFEFRKQKVAIGSRLLDFLTCHN